MKVEVTMPEEYMGDVIGDLNSTSWTYREVWTISAVVRLYMHMYHLQRCSVTLQTFVLRHRDVETTPCSSRRYEPVPKNVQEKVLANHAK